MPNMKNHNVMYNKLAITIVVLYGINDSDRAHTRRYVVGGLKSERLQIADRIFSLFAWTLYPKLYGRAILYMAFSDIAQFNIEAERDRFTSLFSMLFASRSWSRLIWNSQKYIKIIYRLVHIYFWCLKAILIKKKIVGKL